MTPCDYVGQPHAWALTHSDTEPDGRSGWDDLRCASCGQTTRTRWHIGWCQGPALGPGVSYAILYDPEE